MTLAAVKEKLHDFIDNADGKKVKAMYTLFENEIEQDFEIDEATMKELDKRWEDYLSGKSKSYTLEEAKKNIKLHRENRKNNAI